jgi:hypothetical protein
MAALTEKQTFCVLNLLYRLNRTAPKQMLLCHTDAIPSLVAVLQHQLAIIQQDDSKTDDEEGEEDDSDDVHPFDQQTSDSETKTKSARAQGNLEQLFGFLALTAQELTLAVSDEHSARRLIDLAPVFIEGLFTPVVEAKLLIGSEDLLARSTEMLRRLTRGMMYTMKKHSGECFVCANHEKFHLSSSLFLEVGLSINHLST